MKILITGSHGMLGRDMSRVFLLQGHEVWGFDICHGSKEGEHALCGDITNSDTLQILAKRFLISYAVPPRLLTLSPLQVKK